jgi:hypothetical protein
MYFVGPHALRLVFQAFVVLVGFLILAGAVNTSIVGSNRVLALGGGRWCAAGLLAQATPAIWHRPTG